MSLRTSIELYPDGCRVVEVHVGPSARRGAGGDVRVKSFVTTVPGSEAGEPSALAAALATIRRERRLARAAWVTVWGLRSTHQFFRLPPARPDALEAIAAREARQDIAPLEKDGQSATVAISLGGDVQVGAHRRREVSLVAVSTADVRQRIQPVIDAGFRVEGVSTPALALAAVARARRDAIAGTPGAYVALCRRAACLAIVRDGLLLFAREMTWGHGDDDLAARLGSELKRSLLFFKQTFRAAVDSVTLCGDMANLRSLTAPIGEALGIPVATLDSLAGIDVAAVPDPAGRLGADIAALRLAIAVGATPVPPMNLLPAGTRKAREARAEIVRLVAGVAAGVLLTGSWAALVQRTTAQRQATVAALEQQVAQLEPEAARLAELRRAHAVATARHAALAAFESQGPRAARVLETISRAIPDDIVLRAIDLEAEAGAWRATVTGVAIADGVAAGQTAVNTFLDRLSGSPFVGPAIQPPALRVVSGSAASAASGQPVVVPAGMSGVEFTALFRIPR